LCKLALISTQERGWTGKKEDFLINARKIGENQPHHFGSDQLFIHKALVKGDKVPWTMTYTS
jgi:hypothetical protein